MKKTSSKSKIIKKIKLERKKLKERIEEVKKLENLFNSWTNPNGKKYFRKLIVRTNRKKFLHEDRIIRMQIELENLIKIGK